MNKVRLATLAAVLVLLAACTPQPRPTLQPPVAAPEFNPQSYMAEAASGMPVYEIDSIASKIWIQVGVAGPLANLGHPHAITSASLEGYARLAQADSRADMRLPLRSLLVDTPEARRHLQLEGDYSENTVSGTREHMLESLQADQYPDLLIQIHALRTSGDSVTAVGALYLHGVIRPIEVPVDIIRSEAELRVSGAFQIRQTDFGITPYSALNGGLRVADELFISFSLLGRRWLPR